MNSKELARKLIEQTRPELEPVSEQLGVAIDQDQLAAMKKLVERQRTGGLKLEDFLAFIERAAHAEEELVTNRLKVVGRGDTWVHFLGVKWRDGDRRLITIGGRYHWGSSRIELAWPELTPWRSRGGNDAVAQKWAQKKAEDRIVFELQARPAKTNDQDEAALRAAIAEHPDDPAPRLVFADWLLEQGSPLGELIHLSLSKAPDLKRLRALDESWERWAGPLAPFTQRHFVRAGFVTEVTMTVPAFEKHGEAFFKAHPIRALSLVWQGLTSAHLKRLSATPALELVRELKLERGHFTNKKGLNLAPLSEGDHFARLEALRFGHVGESAEDWRTLFLGLRAPRLRSVMLLSTPLSSTTLQALALNPQVGRLTEVTVEDPTRFKDDAARGWEETFETFAERQPKLERLRLEGDRAVNDAALAPLFSRASKVSLQRLAVRRTGVTGALLHSIARSTRSEALTELAVSVEDRVMVEGLQTVLRAAPIELLEVICNDADVAQGLSEMLTSLPPGTRLEKLRGRGRSQLASRELKDRFDLLP